MLLAAIPVELGIALAGLVGLAAGALVNWAAYWLAWNRRHISPWSPAAADAPPRRASDRIPLWGWLGLRRESSLHGRAFWIRPIIVELLLAGGFAWLYWWEVGRQGLLAAQFDALAGRPVPPGLLVAPTWITAATFVFHALLITLMAAATLIDIDEKTIPDQITVPGTLLAFVLAALVPASLLPHVALRMAAPPAGVAIALPVAADADGPDLYVEPLSLTAPLPWPAELGGCPEWLGLVIGLASYAVWCFALTPRILRTRRGLGFALRVLSARVVRELLRPPLLWIGGAGALVIVAVWFRGGAAWLGLLTALVGMIGGGALVWAVRIVGSAALRKEAMGFGDVTLMMMIGAFLGWQSTIFIFFLAPFAGLVVGILQVILRRDDVIPYGPFLCLAALVVLVCWADLWTKFQDVFGIPWLVPAVLGVGVIMLGAILVLWRNIKEAIFGREHDEDGEGAPASR